MNEKDETELALMASGISKAFSDADRTVPVLADINLQLPIGQSVAIVGSSGAGKSTLLNILGGLEGADSGTVCIDGQDLSALDDKQRNLLRNQKLGFVYQFHHLLSEFTALENVAMPLYISGVARKAAEQTALTFLTLLGLSERQSHRPAELSGGERQRVAIARALVGSPKCVLMDEPTGNLDRQTATRIQSIMIDLQRELSTSFIIVTHDSELASKMDRVLTLADGTLT